VEFKAWLRHPPGKIGKVEIGGTDMVAGFTARARERLPQRQNIPRKGRHGDRLSVNRGNSDTRGKKKGENDDRYYRR